ncbi:TetR/AcrR family transcriptional regulator [Piscinibacter sakaiensis]|uniref:TetR/AcrR family transcriptional regulator n=1 Tax=Piscinibacter sakaiensis TaxID=1547922 RepID=UPI003AB0CB24
MCPRPYRMARRSESAEQTRERIVRATYELHGEKGIAATSMRDIAQRADVAIGSVYHHFPSYGDVIDACGAYTLELTQPPTPDILDGISSADERLQVLVDAVFSFYQRCPMFGLVRSDRGKFEQVEGFMQQEESTRRALLDSTVHGRRVAKSRLALAFAMLDFTVHRSLLASGLSHEQAVAEVAACLRQWLLEPGPTVKPGAARRTSAA